MNFVKSVLLPAAMIATVFAMSPASADWPRFRGPNGSGISDSTAPTEFGENKNLKWKVELPGPGVSSPIVVGDKVFVTSYTGYGGDLGNNIEDLKRHLICVNRLSGKILWKKTVDARMPEDEWRPPGVTTHGYASNTPVSDGEHVYAFFGKSGVHAYDLDGKKIWDQSVGQERSNKRFGSAASPIIVGDKLVVNAADESFSIVWLDKKTGKELHRAEAQGLSECWTTPVEVKNGDKSEIALSVIGEIWGLSNDTGKLSWYANGVNSRNAQVSLIANDGIVYASGAEAFAVKVGGKDDVSKSNTVWDGRLSSRYATPVLMNDHLFTTSGSVIECVNAKTGERAFQGRLPSTGGGNAGGGRGGRRGGGRGGFGGGRGGGGDYASPVVAGDKIYFTTSAGKIHVIEAESEFKLIATNDMSFDKSGFGATPAVSDGCLFLRSNSHLYCVGADEE